MNSDISKEAEKKKKKTQLTIFIDVIRFPGVMTNRRVSRLSAIKEGDSFS